MAKKNEASEEAKKPVTPTTLETPVQANYNSKMEAIKDLIFGEENAALRQSIEELTSHMESEVQRVEDKYSALASEMDKATSNRIDNLEMDLKAEIDRLDEHKTDRFKLGKMLEDIGKTLQER